MLHTDNMDTQEILETNRTANPVLATIDAITYWRDFITNLLPETSRGIQVYFKNACSGSFTYQIL
jgi:hypothetical protein